MVVARTVRVDSGCYPGSTGVQWLLPGQFGFTFVVTRGSTGLQWLLPGAVRFYSGY